MFQIQNNSIEDVNPIIDILNQFIPFSQKKLGFNKPVSLFLQSDEENANKILGKTAFYNPAEFSVTVFTSGRHPKDILRSLSHELVHHAQNCRGDFEGNHIAGEGYAQKDPHMRNMELEAYEKGNIIFRDFEDLIKADEININLSGESQMSLKEWRDNELNTLLMEKWGFSSKEKLNEAEEEDVEDAGLLGVLKNNPKTAEKVRDVTNWAGVPRDFKTGKPSRRSDADAEGLRPGGGGDAAASVGPVGTAGPGVAGTVTKPKVQLKKPEAVKEGCGDLEDDEMEIDISKPDMGMEVHVQDLDDLTPDEAFGAGWAAAAQAIEDALANAPHEAEEAGEELEEGWLQNLLSGGSAGRAGGKFSPSPGRVTDDSRFKRKKKSGSGNRQIQAAGELEPTQESLSLDEAEELAKRIFTKLLREADDEPPPFATNAEGEQVQPEDLKKRKKKRKKGHVPEDKKEWTEEDGGSPQGPEVLYKPGSEEAEKQKESLSLKETKILARKIFTRLTGPEPRKRR